MGSADPFYLFDFTSNVSKSTALRAQASTRSLCMAPHQREPYCSKNDLQVLGHEVNKTHHHQKNTEFKLWSSQHEEKIMCHWSHKFLFSMLVIWIIVSSTAGSWILISQKLFGGISLRDSLLSHFFLHFFSSVEGLPTVLAHYCSCLFCLSSFLAQLFAASN